jgi:hypothetical protein
MARLRLEGASPAVLACRAGVRHGWTTSNFDLVVVELVGWVVRVRVRRRKGMRRREKGKLGFVLGTLNIYTHG